MFNWIPKLSNHRSVAPSNSSPSLWRGRWNGTLVACVVGAIALTGCMKETTTPEEENTPNVPSPLSMQFNLGALSDESGRPAGEITSQSSSNAATRWNWINAAIRVTAINLVMVEVLRHPVEVIELALTAEPEYIGEDTFRWRYTWAEGGESITIDLTGEVDTAALHWELRLTGKIDNRTLDNELWFYGDTNRQSESGFWVFSDLETSPTDVARIDWNLNDAKNRSLVFENIKRGDEEFGDQLAYRVSGNNVSVEVLDDSKNERAIMEWDETTGAGSITVPDYNSGVRACWNETQDDVDCVEIGAAS